MRRALLLWTLALLTVANRKTAAQASLVVPVVDFEPHAVQSMLKAYRFENKEHEVLYCVRSWNRGENKEGVQRLVITAVQRVLVGSRHAIASVREQCLTADGKPQPTIHTHADGNCQPSPRDLLTAASRRAEFEGIQCGERHFVWLTSWQIAAFVQLVEQAYAATTSTSPR